MTPDTDAIGFVGLGTMGLPMAVNLAKGFPTANLYVYDISTEAIEKLQAAVPTDQIVPCQNSAEVVSHADVLISIVPEGTHVRQVYLDEECGVIATSLAGKLLLECSTIDPATSQDVAAKIKGRAAAALFYDAPVSGGSIGAENGTLTFMVGSSQEDPEWPRLEGLLSKMGKSILPCGSPTMGLVAKLSNNYCSALIALATSEAMNIGMKSGMDPRVLAQVFSKSTAQSTICDKWCPVPGVVADAPSSKGYKGGFKIQLMKKDFSLAMEAARTVGAKTILGVVGLDVYSDAAEDPDCKDLDSRVVFRYIGGNEDWATSKPQDE